MDHIDPVSLKKVFQRLKLAARIRETRHSQIVERYKGASLTGNIYRGDDVAECISPGFIITSVMILPRAIHADAHTIKPCIQKARKDAGPACIRVDVYRAAARRAPYEQDSHFRRPRGQQRFALTALPEAYDSILRIPYVK